MHESEPREPQGELTTIGRRGFVRYLLGFSVVSTIVGVLTPVISYLWPPTRPSAAEGGRTLVGTVDEFPSGVGKIIPVNDKAVIVVNTQQGIRVFSAICTHFGCIVLEKEPGLAYIKCPCHDGRWNPLTGAVIAGPPPRPLPAYEFSVEENNIYVGEPLGVLYGG